VKPLLFHHKAVDTNSGKVPDETIRQMANNTANYIKTERAH